MINEEIKAFIEKNIDLIEHNKWGQLYRIKFPEGFTDALLESGINPLNQGLNYIPMYFLYNSKLEEFTIPDNVTYIGESAFFRCSSLTSIIIPNSVTIISNSAFAFCTSLTSVEIPNSVTSIGDYTVSHCTSLTIIEYGGTKEQWKNISTGYRWVDEVPATKIICTDGEIIL